MTEPSTSHVNQSETRYAGHELARLVSGLKTAPRGSATLVILAGGSTEQKAATAESIAKQVSSNLFRVDLGQVVGKYIGETEKNLDRLFADAARTGAVLFFDEADALFGRRTDIPRASDHSDKAEMNYLLPRIDTYSGIVLVNVNDAGPTREWASRLRRARMVVVDH